MSFLLFSTVFGHEIDAPVAFPALIVFNIITVPLLILPFVINAAIEYPLFKAPNLDMRSAACSPLLAPCSSLLAPRSSLLAACLPHARCSDYSPCAQCSDGQQTPLAILECTWPGDQDT